MKIIFEEKQNFTQKFIWFMVSGLFFLSIFAIIQQFIFDIPFGTNPAPDYVLIIILCLTFLLVLFMWTANLKTQFTTEYIQYRFSPFHLKTRRIYWSDVNKAYIRVYSPIGEYGGWGIRQTSNGKAFNVQGRNGLQLELRNGKKILFGTQKPADIEGVLDQINLNGNEN